MRSLDLYDLSAYDFILPPELIAQYPVAQREQSRLLVTGKNEGYLKDCFFENIVDCLYPGDALVLNETRVIPARLQGFKSTGGQAEMLLLRREARGWEALVKPARRLPPGAIIHFADTMAKIMIGEELPFPGGRMVRFIDCPDETGFIDQFGQVPLPPYVSRSSNSVDKERYQTVYAKVSGSAAAPTAGLHFSSRILQRIQDKGVELVKVVLHIGVGTFRPVVSTDIRNHIMHSEYYEVSAEAVKILRETRMKQRRVVAVGTTVIRVLETVSALDPEGKINGGYRGKTDIFIYPGYEFKAVDALLTNFHLPRSSLLMLVAAFAGYDTAMAAYRHAVAGKYRFFSYGDAMLVE